MSDKVFKQSGNTVYNDYCILKLIYANYLERSIEIFVNITL